MSTFGVDVVRTCTYFAQQTRAKVSTSCKYVFMCAMYTTRAESFRWRLALSVNVVKLVHMCVYGGYRDQGCGFVEIKSAHCRRHDLLYLLKAA